MADWKKWFGITEPTSRKRGKETPSFRDNLKAFKFLPPFFKLIWETHRGYTLTNGLLRIFKAGIPVTTLYIGKLIIDEVVFLMDHPEAPLTHIGMYVTAELVLVVLSALMLRLITLIDSLLGDLFSNEISVRIIEQAARLDLPMFEDSLFYDKLERARRQSTGRVLLMSQIFMQVQDLITIFFLGAGLVWFNPWLIILLILAVIPAFLSETYFNRRSYSLARNWTPERRELDYLRFVGASDHTAKEIKIFGLEDFLKEKFSQVADRYYQANKKLAVKRFGWGLMFNTLGDIGYYIAYAVIILQTVGRPLFIGGFNLLGSAVALTLGDLTFLAGSFSRL
ncbi:MAG: ABC transporter ATP-binding protein, partial [Bacteroidota bacterium]